MHTAAAAGCWGAAFERNAPVDFDKGTEVEWKANYKKEYVNKINTI